MSASDRRPWYREGTLWLVCAILGATFVSGAGLLALALSGDDGLVISADDYRDLRDEMRLTKARESDDER